LLFYYFVERKKNGDLSTLPLEIKTYDPNQTPHIPFTALHPISFQEADIYAIRSFFPWKKTKELFRKKKKGAARFDLKIKKKTSRSHGSIGVDT